MTFEVTDRKILFVEDDKALLKELTEYFKGNGNVVFAADTLKAAREILERERLDAIVLDVILPDGEGPELLKEDKKRPPVVILSDLGGEEDVLSGLFSGAVDYVVKPCSPKLLETRLALRLLPKQSSRILLHELELDASLRTVKYRKKTISLTGSEFNVLHFLMLHAGEFFSSKEIYEYVWKAPSLRTTTIKRHLSTLRCKLKEVTDRNLIVTEFGKGYCFVSGEET